MTFWRKLVLWLFGCPACKGAGYVVTLVGRKPCDYCKGKKG
jgi:DnaJ-class molecular chaperone